jgi:hypothetical protein
MPATKAGPLFFEIGIPPDLFRYCISGTTLFRSSLPGLARPDPAIHPLPNAFKPAHDESALIRLTRPSDLPIIANGSGMER